MINFLKIAILSLVIAGGIFGYNYYKSTQLESKQNYNMTHKSPHSGKPSKIADATTPKESPFGKLLNGNDVLGKSSKKRTTTGTTTTTTSTRAIKWGAYAGWQVADFKTVESKVAKPLDYLAVFVHWGNENEFPIDVANYAKTGGKTTVIYWEAMDYNVDDVNDSRFSYNSILAGKWDDYINSFAKSAKSFGGNVILIPFEEANGDWYPWSAVNNSNSTDLHKKAYAYLKNKFVTAGATNVKFGWTMNSVSVPNTTENSIDKFYPGDSVVDIIGIDGFNFGNPWLTYTQIFDSALNTVYKYNKPIILTSMACAEGAKKPAWIADAINQIRLNSKITGFIWFNENKERDWRIWSDASSLTTFQNAIK